MIHVDARDGRLVFDCRHFLTHVQQSTISSTRHLLPRPCVLTAAPPRHRSLTVLRLNELPLLASWPRLMLLPLR